MRKIRIIVVGGGATGCMAAIHMERTIPGVEVVQIYDPRLPPVGVGEGTIPSLARWLSWAVGASQDTLSKRLLATRKQGVRYYEWGKKGGAFEHPFFRCEWAYHLSARHLVEFLREHFGGTVMHRKVTHIMATGRGVVIRTENGESMNADYVFDARGFFTKPPGVNVVDEIIPTNAALVGQSKVIKNSEWTGAYARPHGWIFTIPLRGCTSVGYVHNRHISPLEEVRDDYQKFTREQGLKIDNELREVRFNNYVYPEWTDGKVFRLGAAWAFVEPLDSVSFGVVVRQIYAAENIIRGHGNTELATVNKEFEEIMIGSALFLSWHYWHGSTYQSDFWKYCETLEGKARRLIDQRTMQTMDHAVSLAREVCLGDIQRSVKELAIPPSVRASMNRSNRVGLFSQLNFSVLDRGLNEREDYQRFRVT